MSAKIKMFITYAVCFMGLYLVIWFLTGLVMDPDNTVRKLAPIIVAFILSPKPHVTQTQSGRQYGLKSIFFKKIIHFKD